MMGLEWLFVVALACYSTAIWADRASKKLLSWMIAVFAVGLVCDMLGTVLLCATVAEAWRPTLHMLTGTASLVIMAVHFAWAMHAALRGGTSEARFRRWSAWAWALWLVSFFSGAVI